MLGKLPSDIAKMTPEGDHRLNLSHRKEGREPEQYRRAK